MRLSENERSALSRRTVLRAGAWTLPAVAIVVATPAMAASGEPAACLAFDGTGQLIPDTDTGELTMSPAAVAAVTVWLSENSLAWPTGSSTLTAQLSVEFIGTLDGATVDTFLASGSSAGPVQVLSDGSVPGATDVMLNAGLIAQANYLDHIAGFPSTVSWSPVGSPRNLATLSLPYSNDCALTLTYVPTVVSD